MNPTQPNPDAFKSLVLAQHPNGIASDGRKYSDIPAAELTQMIVTKYPTGVTSDGTPYKNYLQPVAKPDLLTKATDAVDTVFPGKEVGEDIGTLAGYGVTAAKEKLGLVPKGTTKEYDLSAPSPLQAAGDAAQGALTVAAPEIGNGASVLGRIGANAALGAGLGAFGGFADKEGAGQIAEKAAAGGALGAGGSAAAEGIGALASKLPSWFVKSAFPSLKDSNVDSVIKNTSLGTTKQLLEKSDAGLNSYGSQIKSILSHPNYSAATGDVGNILKNAQSKFSNAGLQDSKILSIVKRVAPANASIVDKIANGTASLAEQNTLRQELDHAVYPKFTDTPSLTFNKQVGKTFADALRSNVQKTAPETAPVFSEYSKEFDLNKALRTAAKKNTVKQGVKDTGSVIAGYQADGIKGAIAALLLERGLGSTGGKLAAAKAVTAIGKSAPVARAAFQGLKAPLIRAVTRK